jgi:Double zinc ribbon
LTLVVPRARIPARRCAGRTLRLTEALVICRSCLAEAPSDAGFCPECGVRLLLVCSACETPNAPGHRFCKRCGQPLAEPAADHTDAPRFTSPQAYTPRHLAEKIVTSRSAIEGERKLVTVLFVDVSGFTALSEALDPEDVHQVMDRAFELMLAEVHRYEGTVNQFLPCRCRCATSSPSTRP